MPPATGTIYERKLQAQIDALSDRMFAIPLGDSHAHARLVGVRVGLEEAMALYKAERKRGGEDEED